MVNLAVEPPILLRVEEAAAACAISRSKAYELIAAGELPSIRLGASVRVPKQALLEWIDAQLQARAR